jgi:hypothetical protein
MGPAVSVNRTRVNNDFSSSVYAGCAIPNAVNVTNLEDITYTQPAHCPPSSKGLHIEQNAVLDAQCVINTLQKQLAETISKMESNAQAALGFAVSTNVNDIQNQISQKLTTKCEAASATNKVEIKGADVTACQLVVIQNATARMACQLDALQDLVNRVESEQKAESSGTSFFGLIFGSTGGIIVTIAIVIIIIIIIIIVITKYSKKFQKGGFLNYQKFHGNLILCAITLLVILLMINIYQSRLKSHANSILFRQMRQLVDYARGRLQLK